MIKIPNASQKELKKLLQVRNQIEIFQTDIEFTNYLTNMDINSIKKRNIYTIFSNLKSNKLFKYSGKETKSKIKDILFAAPPLKILTKGEVFKLYLYLYEDELEDEKIQKLIESYSEDNFKVTKESFIKFIIKESKNLYDEWNFPKEIKVEYKIYEDVVKKMENPETLNELSPIILELSRYINMENFDEKLRKAIKDKMLEAMPKEVRDFFQKYKRLDFNKIEKIDNTIFILLKGRNIISLTTRGNKILKIELIEINRYKRIVESEMETSQQRLREKSSMNQIKNFKELAKKLRDYGYDIKWLEIDTIPKIFGILVGGALVIGGFWTGIKYIWTL